MSKAKAVIGSQLRDSAATNYGDESSRPLKGQNKLKLLSKGEKKSSFNTVKMQENKVALQDSNAGRKRGGQRVKKKLNYSTLSRLQRYSYYDKHTPENQRFNPYESFDGPVRKRKTTNCCCLILPIILAIYFVARVVYTHINGWPTSLMHPRDFRGQLCGVGRRSDEKYLYYLAPTKDLNVAICVDECPSTTGKPIFIYEGRSKENTPFFYTQIQCDTVGNYCYPQEYKPREKVDKKLSEYENVFLRIISDLYNTFDLFLLTIFIVNLLCFIMIYLLQKKKAIQFMVWGCILFTILTLEGLAYLNYLEYRRLIDTRCLLKENRHGCGGASSTFFLYLAIAFAILGIFYMAYMSFMFNSLNLGIGIMQSSLPITTKIWEMKFVPTYPVIFLLLFAAGLMSIIYESFSKVSRKKIPAEAIDQNVVITYLRDYSLTYFIPIDVVVVYFFCLFASSWAQFVSSYTICIWFYNFKKETVKLDLGRAITESLRYHLGSMVYLSVMLLLFKPLKLFTGLIFNTLNRFSQKNIFVRFLMAGCFPCLFIHFKFFRYLSKTSIVQINMWSHGYAKAAKQAYFLLQVRHGDRGVGNNALLEFVLRQIKYSLALVGLVFSTIYCLIMPVSPAYRDIRRLESKFSCGLFSLIISFFIATIYTEFYDMTIKALVHCRLIDEEMHVGDQRFASPVTDEMMGFWRKKKPDAGFDASAKGKKIDGGEDAKFGDEIYAELKDEEDDEPLYDKSSESSGGDDDYGEREIRKANYNTDWIMTEKEREAKLKQDEEEQKKKAEKRARREQRRKEKQAAALRIDDDEENTKPIHPEKKGLDYQENSPIVKAEPNELLDQQLAESQYVENPYNEPEQVRVQSSHGRQKLLDPQLNKLPDFQEVDGFDQFEEPEKEETRALPQIVEKKPLYNQDAVMPEDEYNFEDENRKPEEPSKNLQIPNDSNVVKSINFDDKAKSIRSKKSSRSKRSKREKEKKHRSERLIPKDNVDADFGDIENKSSRSKRSKRRRERDKENSEQIRSRSFNPDVAKESSLRDKDIYREHRDHREKDDRHKDREVDEFDPDRRSRSHRHHKDRKHHRKRHHEDPAIEDGKSHHSKRDKRHRERSDRDKDKERGFDFDEHRSHRSSRSKRSRRKERKGEEDPNKLQVNKSKDPEFFEELGSIVDKNDDDVRIMNASMGNNSLSMAQKGDKTKESFRYGGIQFSDDDDDDGNFYQ